MRKKLIPLIALLMILAVVAVAYSVAITLESTDINQLGATYKVDVYCPTSECKIDRVKWVLTGPPYMVNKVKVLWTPRSSDPSTHYKVYVELYDSTAQTLKAYGFATQQGSNQQVETEVDLDQNVDPYYVYYVRIVIVQN